MNTAIQLVQHTANKLKQEGKQPNLALLKARLAGQLDAKALFLAYQQWRQLPLEALEESQALASEAPLLAAPPSEHSAQLTRIEQKLDTLIRLLEQRHVSG